ncbi:uncharacterized protein LOC770248 isoform X1 [Gallus gallus]|uniref:uncharacterized protein LOC770248 isoform X1 n=1 Tax=Gallus gallus TaxID=9031 RepID=UPI001AE95EC7|nr:uncharacterized protein LOC770248 isoform X1 [Gallus gallus]XP_040514557.1 uncharacterized protein LOC770248 isoform X1 [Gallus gallus]
MRGGVTERRSAPIAIRRGVTWKQAPKNSRANDERRPGDRAERSGGGEEEQSSCQVIFSTAPTNFGLTLKRTRQMLWEIQHRIGREAWIYLKGSSLHSWCVEERVPCSLLLLPHRRTL